jgi:hypothetical protein
MPWAACVAGTQALPDTSEMTFPSSNFALVREPFFFSQVRTT